jgi:XapX domain-containing protein
VNEFISSLSNNLLALGTGAIVGAIFAVVKLPIPAPRVLPGIIGIVGLWLGYVMVTLVVRRFF